jgi:hypothetical protein
MIMSNKTETVLDNLTLCEQRLQFMSQNLDFTAIKKTQLASRASVASLHKSKSQTERDTEGKGKALVITYKNFRWIL